MLVTLASLALLLGAEAAQLPNKSYAPYYVDCPKDIQLARKANCLSDVEAKWVHGRKAVAGKAFAEYLKRLNLADFDLNAYTKAIHDNPDHNMPVLAMAQSGGGWRSAFTGVGGLRAFDAKFPPAIEQKTGGLLQSFTYYAALSGGSWPPSSLAFNNYPPVDDLVKTWHVEINRFTAQNDTKYAASALTYFDQVAPKFDAGFNLSVVDYLGRAYAYEFLPGQEGGLDETWSSIAEISNFKNFNGPMPILQASSLDSHSFIEEGLYVPRQNATIYEWNPYEFGSWDVGFTPTKYVGTVPKADGTAEKCVENLDQASFVMSSAAAAFNYWWVGAVSNYSLGAFSKRSNLETRQAQNGSSNPFFELLEEIRDYMGQRFNLSLSQIANPSIPNPFGGKANITLSDNSEAGQAIPFWSVIQPQRKVDFIIAWDDDSDDDPYGWNNGTNVWDTYNLAKAAHLPFPQVPPPETFLARNYTIKPTLFGCDSKLTTTGDSSSPIVLYLTNAPYSWYSNFTWLNMNISETEFYGVLDNSFNLVTQGNGTLDADWTKCIGCAAIDRSLERVNMTRTKECEQCFKKHCWDGTTSELPKDFVFDPSLQLDPSLGFDVWKETHPFSGM